MMVDWLTVELPDPVGVPVNAGEVFSISREGEVEWSTPKRLNVEGSWSSNMTFRARVASSCSHEQEGLWQLRAASGAGNIKQSGLEISGNPAKFLTGHNLFGSADVAALLAAVVDKAKGFVWPELPFENPPVIDFSEGQISRIDLTSGWLLDRQEDVQPVLRAMEERVWVPHRGRGVMDAGGSTLYYGLAAKGKRAKDWALKLYWKGPELTAHPLPKPAYDVVGLLEWAFRLIRVELTLRTAELKKLGLRRVGDWTPEKVREIWEMYVGKLDFGESTVNLDTVDLASLGLKPRHQHALASWKAGNDLRAGMSKTAYYRLRKELRAATGYDIATLCPKSNVVPLRRVVNLSPVLQPHWADHLTAALSKAA